MDVTNQTCSEQAGGRLELRHCRDEPAAVYQLTHNYEIMQEFGFVGSGRLGLLSNI